MPSYRFRAINDKGRVIKGRLECLNVAELEKRLQQQGLEIIHFGLALGGFSLFRRHSKRRDLIDFCFQLEQLTRAGIPLIDGLRELYHDTDSGPFKLVLASLVEDVQAGIGFSDALKRHPHVFDDVFIALISTGELSGNLPEIFRRLAENLKWLDELIAQIKKILIYPIFTLVIVMAVFLFLMLYLVPQLSNFMLNMNVSLPFQTKLLLGMSQLLKAHWLVMGIGMISVPVSLFLIVRRSSVSKRVFDRVILKFPYIGAIVTKIILARFTSLFALLYGSGINILQSLQMLRSSTGNSVVTRNLMQVEQLILDGQPISDSFRTVGFFPSLVIRMLKIGESTGQLDNALNNASYFYSREVQEAVGKLQSLIEPILTVLIGGLLGWLMLSVLGPLYEMLEKIKF